MLRKPFVPLAALMSALLLLTSAGAAGYAEEAAPGTSQVNAFRAVTAVQAAKAMSPGWNLGNTLDAYPDEGSWNNPPAEETIFEDIRAAGFRSVRIPVTWDSKIGSAPDYIIDPARLDRVEEVVDWALERGLYTVLNVHHDNGNWVTKMAVDPVTGLYVDDYNRNMDKLEKVWKQIAGRFKDKSEKLLFEVLNEPNNGEWEPKIEAPTDPDYPEARHHLTPEELNAMNHRMLKAIRTSGGSNASRIVVIGAEMDNSEKAVAHLEVPDDPYLMATFHYYTPYPFISNSWGHTAWGTPEDKAELTRYFKPVYDTFVRKGIPVLLGEFGTFVDPEAYAKSYYFNAVVRASYKYGFVPMYWDNGLDNYDRKARVWRDEAAKDVIVRAALGEINSFIGMRDAYFPQGKEPGDLVLPLELGGNELTGIYHGYYRLVEGRDYVMNEERTEMTLYGGFIAKLLPAQGEAGAKETLRFRFSEGADQPLNLIRFAQPVLQDTKLTIPAGALKENLKIPVQYNGTKLATARMVDAATGRPVKDEWAQGYVNRGDFVMDAEHVILSKEILNGRPPGSETKIILEFWPKGTTAEITVSAKAVKPEPGYQRKVTVLPRTAPKVDRPLTIEGTIVSLNGASVYKGVIDVEIHDAEGNKVEQRIYNEKTLKPDEPLTVSFTWKPQKRGKYIVKFSYFTTNWKENLFWDDAARIIEVQ
ncbi:endoglucanase [Paenibacillus mucilaginosus]